MSMSIGVKFKRVAQSVAITLPAVAASAYYTATSSSPALSVSFNIAVGAFLYATRFKPENYKDVVKVDLDAGALERLNEIARNIGLKKSPNIYFVNSAVTTSGAGARGNNVFFESGLLNISDEEEREFAVGHECAHILRKDTLLTEASEAASKIAVLNAAGSVLVNYTPAIQNLEKPVVFISALIIGAGLKGFFTRRAAVHEMEYDCDRRSVLAMGDKGPGKSLLMKLGLCAIDAPDAKKYPHSFARVNALSSLKL